MHNTELTWCAKCGAMVYLCKHAKPVKLLPVKKAVKSILKMLNNNLATK